MSDATIGRLPRRAPEYVANPDMAAFTIGQIVIVALREQETLSVEMLCEQLERIASGRDDVVVARVTPDMALGALRYIQSSLQIEAA